MTILHKIINAAVNRLSLGPRGRRDLIDTVLRKLPQASYWRLREQGFAPGGILDIGAHEGHWTRMIRTIFPAPPILMIEAREELERALKNVCTEISRAEYVIALLGHEAQPSAQFHVSGTGSSLFAERSDAPAASRTIPMRTLDDVVSKHPQLAAPLFLKLDIQGAELECLLGGSVTLAGAEVIQLEVALLNYNEGAPQVTDVIPFMDSHGFALFDINGFVRPNGIDLVQLDMLFVKKSSAFRPNFFRFRKMIDAA
jgi:FkbM family methyltransferase